MNQIIEFFENLFGTESWPPRWKCGEWSDFHGWLYIYSDIIIWLAYFIIPVILIWFFQKSPQTKIKPVFLYFGAFILLCGATHIIDAFIFWVPIYRFSAFIRLLTAIVSMVTVYSILRELNTYSSFLNGKKRDLHILNESLRKKNQKIMELEKRIKELEK